MAFVYITPLLDKSAFKIGKTVAPSSRISQLSQYYDFDLTRVLIVCCGTTDSAFNLESILHKACQGKHVFMPYDGGTEFFSYDVYSDILSITKSVCAINDYEIIPFVRDQINDPFDEVSLIIEAFSNKIRARRLEMDLSQAEVAEMSGLSVRTIRNIESQCKSAFHNVVSVLRVLNLENLFADLEVTVPFRQRASGSRE
jgi:hypothetical protein